MLATGGPSAPLSADDFTGYVACLVSSFMFGSNFVPVKRVYTGDGMFFTLMMTAAVFYEGCFIQLWQGNPKFEPVAMLGGALWATGNITVVPIVKTIGLGIGLLVWGLVSMLVGWASGHFGIFWRGAGPPVARTLAQLPRAAARHRVPRRVREDQVRGCGGFRFELRPAARGRVRVRAPLLPESTPLVSDADGGGVVTFPVCPTFPDSAPDEWGGAGRRRARTSRASRVVAGFAPARQRPNRFAFGFTLSVVAGCFYGVNFNPPQHVIDEARRETSNLVHSRESRDYVSRTLRHLPRDVGVLWGVLCHQAGQRAEAPDAKLRAPRDGVGLMWGAGEISWLVANLPELLGDGFHHQLDPGVVGALWAVLVFGEIKGRDNYVLLVVSGVMRLFAVVLIALSKNGL